MEGERELTIDELAAETHVPTRTIRFYQSTGALPKPTIKGRVAYYGQAHVERLANITALQDRGLQIKAIREVLDRAERGEFDVADWLGTHDKLTSPWTPDAPKVMTAAELQAELEGRRPGILGELVRVGAVERRGDAYLVESPALFAMALRLERVGVPVDTLRAALELMKKHLGRLAGDLTDFLVENADAFGDGDDAYAELRPVTLDAVRIVFGRAMDRSLAKAKESRAAAAFRPRRRDKSKRR